MNKGRDLTAFATLCRKANPHREGSDTWRPREPVGDEKWREETEKAHYNIIKIRAYAVINLKIFCP